MTARQAIQEIASRSDDARAVALAARLSDVLRFRVGATYAQTVQYVSPDISPERWERLMYAAEEREVAR